ncbi:hypothetical protein CTAYLR_007323 [Chrysophaeum taylorii]|uniref:Uncharacterized protein n=1 Tax=Chrysophaeum taylorii TaxID=2483200 RepID=A0AAD7U7Z1_9STRA|nr:hypothetical protein CTAYLR_007323 [Chrysophaeum taylorii]
MMPQMFGAFVIMGQACGLASTVRVVIADVGNDVAWFPGDRRVLRSPTPAQASALASVALEELVNPGPALIALLPAVGPRVWGEEAPRLVHGGGGRRILYHAGEELGLSYRRSFESAAGSRVAALCAVRGVRTAGKQKAGKVGLRVSQATLEVIGRVAVRRVEMLPEDETPLWEDDTPTGGTTMVAALGGANAVLEDAWIDELRSSPVHALHELRPRADECARLHDALRKGYADLDVDLDRPLFELAEAATAAAADIPATRSPIKDAYGDVIQTDPEVDTLRALSFAAWRVLRALPTTPVAEIEWAFATRSTLDRLEKAEHFLNVFLDEGFDRSTK